MATNYKSAYYKNGDLLPGVDDETAWNNLTSGAITSINNNFLYNYYAVTDSRGLCPDGWHIPSKQDWDILINFLGGESVAGGKLKYNNNYYYYNSYWDEPNIGATNESGFSAEPLLDENNLYTTGIWWSTTETGSDSAISIVLKNNTASVMQQTIDKNTGAPVRCIKD